MLSEAVLMQSEGTAQSGSIPTPSRLPSTSAFQLLKLFLIPK